MEKEKKGHSFAAIEEEIQGILDLADQTELSEEEQVKIDSYLNELASAESQKVDAFAYCIKRLEDRLEHFSDFISGITAKKRAIENRIKFMKGRYLETMISHGLKKVQGDVFSISAVTRKVVEVYANFDELSQYPPELTKILIEPRKTEIKKFLENGGELPHASIIERTSLMIR